MTLLSVVKDVCAVVGVTQPTSVFSSLPSNRTMQEMLQLANEMARRIAYDTREWRKLKSTKTYTGDGVTTAFDLPSDFQRLLVSSDVWRSTSTVLPMRFVPSTNDWIRRRLANQADARGEWTLIGDQIQIFPVMGTDVSVSFAYIKKDYVLLTAGGFGNSFVNDADRFALDERLLLLGMIWQWKAWKGTPYVEDMSTYSDALAMAQGADTPAPVIVGRLPVTANIYASYPFGAPTP